MAEDTGVIDLTIDDLIREATPIAKRVAKQVHGQFKGFIERDDLEQELMLWVLGHESAARRYLTPDEDGNTEEGRKKLHVAFRRFARGVGHKAKAQNLGYDVSDLHFYSNALVEELLPRALSYDAWLPSQATDASSGRGSKSPALGNDLFAMLADVKGAWEKLDEADRELLFRRFCRTPPEDAQTLAYEAGVSRQAIDKRVDRALGRIVAHLGGTRPDFGS